MRYFSFFFLFLAILIYNYNENIVSIKNVFTEKLMNKIFLGKQQPSSSTNDRRFALYEYGDVNKPGLLLSLEQFKTVDEIIAKFCCGRIIKRAATSSYAACLKEAKLIETTWMKQIRVIENVEDITNDMKLYCTIMKS